MPLAAREPGQPDHLLDAAAPLDAGNHVDAGIEREVLVDREVVVEREALGHVADRRFHPFGIVSEVDAEHEALALRRLHDPGEHAERRRFAGAVGAEKPVELASLDREVEVIHGDEAAEPLGEPAGDDGEVGQRPLA